MRPLKILGSSAVALAALPDTTPMGRFVPGKRCLLGKCNIIHGLSPHTDVPVDPTIPFILRRLFLTYVKTSWQLRRICHQASSFSSQRDWRHVKAYMSTYSKCVHYQSSTYQGIPSKLQLHNTGFPRDLVGSVYFGCVRQAATPLASFSFPGSLLALRVSGNAATAKQKNNNSEWLLLVTTSE